MVTPSSGAQVDDRLDLAREVVHLGAGVVELGHQRELARVVDAAAVDPVALDVVLPVVRVVEHVRLERRARVAGDHVVRVALDLGGRRLPDDGDLVVARDQVEVRRGRREREEEPVVEDDLRRERLVEQRARDGAELALLHRVAAVDVGVAVETGERVDLVRAQAELGHAGEAHRVARRHVGGRTSGAKPGIATGAAKMYATTMLPKPPGVRLSAVDDW